MNKKITIFFSIITLTTISISGCLDNSNENNNYKNLTDEEKILGLWERVSDERHYHYLENGSLDLENAENHMIYWFEDGFLYDGPKNESLKYKYLVNFSENNETMTHQYIGYYIEDVWNPSNETIIYTLRKRI